MARPRRPSPQEGEALISTGTVRFERDRDDPDGWLVLVNGVPSSYVDLADPTRLDFEYQQWTAAVLAAVLPAPQPVRAAHLGGAGCVLPRYLEVTRPGSAQVVFEVDERLVELTRTAFGLRSHPRFRVRVKDGRAGVAGLPDASQDTVVRDAFAHDAVPAHLCSREFLAEVARVLAPGGVYVANLADRPPMPRSRAELATALDVFGHVALVAEPAQLRGRRYGNVLLVASPSPLPLPALVRGLSGGAAPARVLHGEGARDFAAGAAVITDERLAAARAGSTDGPTR